ncbi:MAG: SUMF1/EgtB/PvdO family nonheme iron enzyme, partial [Planctomycetota bacterium]
PENAPRMRAWLEQSEDLLARRSVHEKTLVEIRQAALPYDEAAREENRKTHPKAKELTGLIEERSDLRRRIEESQVSEGAKELRDEARKLTKKIAKLASDVAERHLWKFESDELAWQHGTLSSLVSGLEDFSSTVEKVRKRLGFSESIVKRSIEDRRSSWDEAIRSIANEEECPLYRGLRIKEQIGLVPIGRDSDSGLWEFAHLQSGDIPARDPKTKKLVLTEEMSIVLVLIPGGSFTMGAVKPTDDSPLGSPNVDPGATVEEGPLHEVKLNPFFLSKYEMTQGQWERFTGENPCFYPEPKDFQEKIGALNPVEQVSWNECQRELARLHLELPTEAQWEYAARAGTQSVWSLSNEKESLRGVVNIADKSAKVAGAAWEAIADWPDNDDGFVVHAPVGTYAPNPWGLHEVHGNVFEWCRDWLGSYRLEVREGDGERKVPSAEARSRVNRGGSFNDGARLARSASRNHFAPSLRTLILGVRPSRPLDGQ